MSETTSYNGVSFSNTQLQILKDAVLERKSRKISLSRASKFYSGKNAAINAMRSLEGKGILERHKEGKWVITNLPQSLHKKWLRS